LHEGPAMIYVGIAIVLAARWLALAVTIVEG
jgi:hypothetical protein